MNPRILSYGQDPGFEILTAGTSSTRYYTAQAGAYIQSSSVFQQDVWHMVTIVRISGLLEIFIDGQLQGNLVANWSSIYNYNFQIGKKSQGTTDHWGGSIDDVRIYNRALSSNEVAQLYAVEADVPVITQQPVSQTVNPGGSATFTVTATAQHPLTYQWQKNGVPIPGATNTSLSFPSAQSSNVGYYSVTVSNAVTGIASASVLLNLTGYADPTWTGLVAYYPFNGNANDASGKIGRAHV